jgi:hypothetical protein
MIPLDECTSFLTIWVMFSISSTRDRDSGREISVAKKKALGLRVCRERW